ncbi:MAG: hypothetical protein ACREE6_18645 [Limisphaerales bacterium]
MIKLIQTFARCRVVWQSNSRRPFRCAPFLQIAVLFLFNVSIIGRAQGNLASFNNWWDTTADIPSTESNEFAFAASPTFVEFNGGQTTNGQEPWVEPSFSGDVNTTDGAMYQISYTLSTGPTAASLYMSFGGSILSYDYQGGDFGFSTNLIYTIEATSASTTMSFVCYLDPSESVDLTDFSVTQVPELSSEKLFAFLGCALLCVRKLRRLQMRACGISARR